MPRADAINTVVLSFLIGLFLQPVLSVTGFADQFPRVLVLSLPFTLPVLAIAGMFIAYHIGHKLPIFWQFMKFALVGVLNTAIDFGVLNLLISITGITSGASIIPVKAFAFSSAVVNSYFWNKKWVFENPKHSNFVIFFAITTAGIAINAVIVFIITTYIPPIIVQDKVLWVNIANVVSTAFSMIWNFTGYRLIVFAK